MLHVIKTKHGAMLIVQSIDNRSLHESQLCIKMAVDAELRNNKFVDLGNLADALHNNNFCIYGHRMIEIE